MYDLRGGQYEPQTERGLEESGRRLLTSQWFDATNSLQQSLYFYPLKMCRSILLDVPL